MLFREELEALARRAGELRRRAAKLRTLASEAATHPRQLRSEIAALKRELSQLWGRHSDAYEKEVIARYGLDADSESLCRERGECLNAIAEAISEALQALNRQLTEAEANWLNLCGRADAAEALAEQAENRYAETLRDRDHYIATVAGVPKEQLNAGEFTVKVSPRYEGQIDVYYNKPGLESLGPGHGHIAISFEGDVLHHRRPGVYRHRVAPKPAPPRHRSMAAAA